MHTSPLQVLRTLPDVQFHPGADDAGFDLLKQQCGIVLPTAHQAVLRASNGLEAYAGYSRLFGLGESASIDAIAWNEPECWKFAWQGRCDNYWCFAETAWGDQFAYALDELRTTEDPAVHLLDAFSMTPGIIAPDFASFWHREFLREATNPADTLTKQARGTLGPLNPSQQLIFMPPLALGGDEDLKNVQKMPRRAAMTCNGDVVSQLETVPDTATIHALQTGQDELGRLRLRLLWA